MSPEQLRQALRHLQTLGHIITFEVRNSKLCVYYFRSTADIASILQELIEYTS